MLKRTSLPPKRKFGGCSLLSSTSSSNNNNNNRASTRINHHVGCLFSTSSSIAFNSTTSQGTTTIDSSSSSRTSNITTHNNGKQTLHGIQSINIGNINVYSQKESSSSEPVLDNNQELLIPNYSLFGEDVSQLDQQKDILSHLKWMAMKDKMKQDMFLIGHFGELKRHLAFTYCQLARRSVEYVCITRDTSEHDFKQRREIEAGSAFYVDQAAVRAAKCGSILILEGLEKADLNILPILNNLMENREMALESGTMLISPQRYKQLIEEEGKTPEELKLMKIEPVHEDFRIIGMGLPVPFYEGNTLDPPLRSRFNARVIDLPSMDSIFSSLVNHRPSNDAQVLSFLSSEQKKSLFLSLIQFTQSIVHLDNMLMNSKDAVNTNSKTGSIELLPRFPIDNLKNLIEMLNDYRSICSSSVENVENLIHSLYPFELFMSREKDKTEDEKLEQNKMIDIIKEQLKECSTKIHQIISKDFTPSSPDLKQELISKMLSHSKDMDFKDIGFVMIEKHRQVLTDMLRSHLCGKDVCLIGSKGSGKSLIAHAFACMVGYKAVVFPMYKEMTSKDLLQKRGTDSEGNTVWKNSVLIDSMIDGSLCILDGIDRMSTDILLSIQTLIQDRVLYLFNGNRYISHEYYDKFLSQGFTREELNSKGIYRIHPDFRIIAIGLNDSLKWLSLELFNLFHFHTVPKLSVEEEVDLLSARVGADSSKNNLIHSLIRIKNDYNNTEFNQDQRLISMRDLIRIVKRSMIFKDEYLLTALERITMTYLLPKHHLELLRKLAVKYKVLHNQESSDSTDDKPVHIERTDTHIQMDEIKAPINLNANLLLVPKPYFVQTEQHAIVMKAMLKDHLIGDHSLLIGYQGVGKNKITDQFLNLLQCEREYMQLHRDITIASLTVQPSVVDGVLTYIDSPLVRAVRHGRILVLDEIDKAPLEVVSILKSLVEDGNMVLGDGRTIVTVKEYQKRKQQNDPYLHKLLPIMKGFRIIALSNPPTFPFHGNSFYDASGDIFSNHYVSNPRGDSEIKLLQSYGPNVPLLIIKKLSAAFDDLRLAVEEGVIQYPYSTRELVHIVKHLQAFPNETTLQDALANVFDFDSFDRETLEFLAKVFQKHEIPVSFNNIEQFSIRMAQEVPLVKTNEGKNICFLSTNPKLTSSCEIQNVPYFIRNYMSNQMYYDEPDSGAFATKNPSDNYTNLMEFSELRYIINLPCNKAKGIASLEDSVHVFSTSNPFGMIHFESNQCDSFKVTELYYIQSKLGSNLSFFSLKNLNVVALLSAKPTRPDRFKTDTQSNFIENDVYALIYHPKLGKKFELDFSYSQFVQNSLQKDVRSLPVQILTEYADSHSKVGLYQSGSRTILLIDMSSWDPSLPIKRGTPPHNSKSIHLPFNIDTVKWLSPNTFLVLEYGGVNNYWKIVQLDGNSVEIKDVSDMSTISLKEHHINSSRKENLLFAQPFIKEDTPQEVFLRKIVRKDDLLTIESDLSLQKGNPKLVNVQTKYLKKSNQLVLLHHDKDGLPTMDVLNFDRNTYRRVTPPERESIVKPSFDLSKQSFVDLSNGYIALLDEENKLLLFNLNVDKLAEECISWKKFNTSGSSDSLQIEYIQQDKEASFPKHGKEDDLPHVGGNTFAGGSGGFDTAGLGGAGGPYRLAKKGNPVYQVSDEVKNSVSKEILERARAMGEQAYKKRLQEIDMTSHEMNLYSQYKNNVTQQIDQLRKTLSGLKWRDEEEERVWVKNQTTGEIDDNKIVEGIVGEKNIYKRRANENEKRKSNLPKKKKVLHFVMDVSGSMYRFNHQDERLDKMLEIAVIVMESFKGFEDRYEYRITGHSGQTSCLELVKRGAPPKDEKERLKVLLKMHAHSQYCWSGDTTVRAIKDASKNEENDFVFVFSDANLSRYGISHQDIAVHLKKNTFIIFIASMFNEAQELKQGLPSSNSFVCLDTRELSTTFKKILSQNITMTKNNK